MKYKIRRAWLFETGLLETICFDSADKKLYWFKTLDSDRFVYCSINGDTSGIAITRCGDPT